jgi:nucleoside-diphosphate-sugar epimerase
LIVTSSDDPRLSVAFSVELHRDYLKTMIRDRLGWEASISLHDGLERTYGWIYDQLASRRAVV